MYDCPIYFPRTYRSPLIYGGHRAINFQAIHLYYTSSVKYHKLGMLPIIKSVPLPLSAEQRDACGRVTWATVLCTGIWEVHAIEFICVHANTSTCHLQTDFFSLELNTKGFLFYIFYIWKAAEKETIIKKVMWLAHSNLLLTCSKGLDYREAWLHTSNELKYFLAWLSCTNKAYSRSQLTY